MRRATIVRADLLRAGRHGESDQGTAAGSVCGSHVDPEAGGESTAFVFLGIRVPDAGHVAPGGTGGNEVGAGAELDPAGEIAEDRGPGPGHDAQGLAVVFRELPPCGVVKDGSGASASPAASLLAKASPLEATRLGVRRTDSALESALWGRNIAHECRWEVKCPWKSPDFGFRHRIRADRTVLEFMWTINH